MQRLPLHFTILLDGTIGYKNYYGFMENDSNNSDFSNLPYVTTMGKKNGVYISKPFLFLSITTPKIIAELKYIIILDMIRDGGLNCDLLGDDT